MSANQPPEREPLTIDISREPGSDYCTLSFSFGGTEEVDGAELVDFICTFWDGIMPIETRAAIERAADDVWNFYAATVILPKWKPIQRAFGAPKV